MYDICRRAGVGQCMLFLAAERRKKLSSNSNRLIWKIAIIFKPPERTIASTAFGCSQISIRFIQRIRREQIWTVKIRYDTARVHMIRQMIKPTMINHTHVCVTREKYYWMNLEENKNRLKTLYITHKQTRMKYTRSAHVFGIRCVTWS